MFPKKENKVIYRKSKEILVLRHKIFNIFSAIISHFIESNTERFNISLSAGLIYDFSIFFPTLYGGRKRILHTN